MNSLKNLKKRLYNDVVDKPTDPVRRALILGGLSALLAACVSKIVTPVRLPAPTKTLAPTVTRKPTDASQPAETQAPPTATELPIPAPKPVDSNYNVFAYYIHGLGADPRGSPRNEFRYATIEPIYGLRQDQLTIMMDIKHARENGIATFVMPSAFPDTTWERRLRDLFLRANTSPYEIDYSLMFNPDPYLWGREMAPYSLETGTQKTIREFFRPRFPDEHYKKIDTKPLVFFFFAAQIAYHTEVNGGLDRLERAVDILRNAAGEDIFLVGDVMVEPEIYRTDPRVNGDPNYYERVIRPFDAITAYYLMRAGEGWLWRDNIPYVAKPFNSMISGFKLACEFWGEKADRYGVKLIPPTMPTGFSNQLLFDAEIDNWLVNRHDSVSYNTSREMAEVVKPYVDSDLRMIGIGAYNEIQEGAAVVPSTQFGFDPIHAVRDAYAIEPEKGWPRDYYP